MAKIVVIDELHLTIRVPADLPDDEVEIVREMLFGAEFLLRLRHGLQTVFKSSPQLARCRISLTR